MTDLVTSILQTYNYDENTSVSDYERIKYTNLIQSTFQHVKIDRIEKLNNKYLYAAFMLKKEEKKNYTIHELIHSTAADNVRSIEKDNLDWRRVQRAKYGYGVSFTRDADYANHHSSWSGGSQKAYIICDVLIASKQVTNTCYSVPSGDSDTVHSTNGSVYVKFDDFTFYPKYALYYEKPSRELSKYNRGRGRRRYW